MAKENVFEEADIWECNMKKQLKKKDVSVWKNLVHFRIQFYITVNRQKNLPPEYEILLIIWRKITRFVSKDIRFSTAAKIVFLDFDIGFFFNNRYFFFVHRL